MVAATAVFLPLCSNTALAGVQIPITALPTLVANASNPASPAVTVGNNTALTQLDLGSLAILPGSNGLQISNNTVLAGLNLTSVSRRHCCADCSPKGCVSATA